MKFSFKCFLLALRWTDWLRKISYFSGYKTRQSDNSILCYYNWFGSKFKRLLNTTVFFFSTFKVPIENFLAVLNISLKILTFFYASEPWQSDNRKNVVFKRIYFDFNARFFPKTTNFLFTFKVSAKSVVVEHYERRNFESVLGFGIWNRDSRKTPKQEN